MSLNLGLIGFGRMGKEIARHAKEKGHKIISTYDSQHRLTADTLNKSIDVFIDFSNASAVVENVKIVARSGKPMVIGTTGWYDQLDEVKAIVQSAKVGVLYASNFSLGMNLFFRIVEHASELFDKFEEYDPFIHEMHHRKKKDSPSGTALVLGKIVLDKIKRKSDILARNSEGPISPKHLHISSTRAGEVPGTHLVGFDSAADTIELKHTARNRSGFALGALYAAEWIVDKQGLFTMDDLFEDIFS